MELHTSGAGEIYGDPTCRSIPTISSIAAACGANSRSGATLAVLIAIAAVLGVATMFRGSSTSLVQASGPQISRVTIRGIIRGDEDRLKALESLANSRATRAVIVHIDSPGGTTVGSEELHDALRRVANKKPMVVVVDGMAASGGYIAAMAADHILTQKTSLVGSIGVLFQVPNVSHLLETIGVKVEEIKSSPLKAAPNGLEPTSPEARAAIESLVRDSYAWFKDMVKERRKLEGEALDRVSDGRVFTGRQGSSSSSSTRSARSVRRSNGSPRRTTSIPRRRFAIGG